MDATAATGAVHAVRDFTGPLSGLVGSFTGIAGMMFKQWWDDRKDERDFTSKEKTIADLINLLKQDLESQKNMNQYTLNVMQANAASLTRLADGINTLVHNLGGK